MTGENDLAVFLVGVALLLGTARLLGELARKVRLPPVAGELAAGILLGPSVVGRLVPGFVPRVFPAGAPAQMLGGYTLMASVLLLTLAGLEIDLSVVLRRRREAALTSVAGVVLPLVLGFGLGFVLPARYIVDPSQRFLFAAFVGTAMSISAMPVIAKTLLDLGLFRTDLGLLVMAAAMVNDLIGWLLFSLLAGPMHGRGLGWRELALTLVGTVLFVVGVLGVGRKLFDQLLTLLERERISAAGRVLSVLFVLAVLGAALTQRIGIHAVFGSFIVGVAVGDSPRLRAETRSLVHEFVSNVFAPVFFAAIGLRVDFVASFDPALVGAFVLIGCAGKVVGCTAGARYAGLSARESLAVGFALNSRGAMEIILALVALESGLIRPQLFVALVVMALVTSLMAGPAMTRLLRARRRADVRALLEEGAVVPVLRARTAEQAIRELAQSLAAGTPLDGNALTEAVLEHAEDVLGGLGDGIALPHARIRGIQRTMLGLGRAPDGLDFNAPDGVDARLVFLLLIPEREAERSVELHTAIVRVVQSDAQRAGILAAGNRAEILDAVARAADAAGTTGAVARTVSAR